MDQFDLSRLKTVHCGAAPLSVDVANSASKRLGVGISYGYGMTELSPLSHLTYRHADAQKPESTGHCLPNTVCKIIDLDSKAELEPGVEGEVCVRGPQVMKGYLNQPEATAELIDSEGWVHTGDVGYADADGALFIVDRLKELIKVQGSSGRAGGVGSSPAFAPVNRRRSRDSQPRRNCRRSTDCLCGAKRKGFVGRDHGLRS